MRPELQGIRTGMCCIVGWTLTTREGSYWSKASCGGEGRFRSIREGGGGREEDREWA